jgi:glycosyltransferase involved in cell wall biosynthesis
MARLRKRANLPFPCTYKDFRLVRGNGRIYGIPTFLDADELSIEGRLVGHPAVLSAATKEELQEQIDRYDVGRYQPQVIGSCDGYNLVRYDGAVYGIPQSAGPADLNPEEEPRHPGVIRGRTWAEVRERIRRQRDAVPVEFAGWLPIYEFSGNCGRHPQFTHTAEPPPGYRFTCSAPPRRARTLWQKVVRWVRIHSRPVFRGLRALVRPFFGLFRGGAAGFAPRARLRVLGAVARLFFKGLCRGAGLFAILRFLQSRHYQSQLVLGRPRGLVFLTSMPYTYGQNPWIIEIEDPTTLFYPFVHNGQTADLRLADTPCFPIVKALLESDQCKGILTHMRSTARMIPTLFKSEKISAKVSYAPLGVKLPQRWQRHAGDEESETIHLLFINSWCQIPGNIYVRGGLDILEAFAILHERYPQLRLTLRTELALLDEHYHRIIEKGWVRVISRFLPAHEMEDLLAESHIFLLPAARVHIVSLLQAMSYGLAVVTSDGWGFDEYIEHERNGLVVKGRYGKASWQDDKEGQLREEYEFMYSPDPAVVEGLVEAVSRLVEDRELRRRLGRAGRADVETKYNLEQWNRGLQAALNKAHGHGSSGSGVEFGGRGERDELASAACGFAGKTR